MARCFPHIMNLACHEVERAIDEIRYNSSGNRGALANVTQDPIATLHMLIKSVSR